MNTNTLSKIVWDMSFPVPNWKFVLVAMASQSDEGGYCDANIDRLAGMTGLDESIVSNAIESLKALKVLQGSRMFPNTVFRINTVLPVKVS